MMQIVIDIDLDTYKEACERTEFSTLLLGYKLIEAVQNGTPLPKGHGRLGDLDKLYTEMNNGIKAGMYEDGYENYGHINDMDDCLECVEYADTIIEADKESEE